MREEGRVPRTGHGLSLAIVGCDLDIKTIGASEVSVERSDMIKMLLKLHTNISYEGKYIKYLDIFWLI